MVVRKGRADKGEPLKPEGRPTAEYVMGLYKHALSLPEERGLRSFIRLSEELFNMAHKVSIPREYRAITQEVRTPFYRDAGMRVAASLVRDPSYLTALPRDETMTSKKAASLATIWLNAQFDSMDATSGEETIFQSARDLVFNSESVIKIVHRPDAWANFPQRAEDESAASYLARTKRASKGDVVAPFARRVVDRRQMVFGQGEYGDTWAIEYGEYPMPYSPSGSGTGTGSQEREALTPAGTLGGLPQPEPGESSVAKSAASGTAIKLEFFDADWWTVILNGQTAPGFPRPNPYAPLLPYARATSFPALYALRYLVPALDSLLTMKMNWAYLSAFPIVVMEPLRSVRQLLDSLPVGDTGEPNSDVTWRPGRAYFPPLDRTMRFLEPPASGRDVDEMIAQIREMIDVAGVPSVFRGIGGSRQPGYAVNQLTAAAQLTFKHLGNSLQRQDEAGARLLLHMVKHTIRQEVYVLGTRGDDAHWVGLRPSGAVTEEVAPIDRLGPVKSTFRPVLPTDEQADAMIGLQSWTSGWMSHETTLERYAHQVDPVGEMDRLVVERALDDPALVADMMAEARRRKGLPVPGAGAPSAGGGVGPAPATPNDVATAGQPTVAGLTQLLAGGQAVGTGLPGGRAAGTFPGQPGGPGTP